MPNLKQIESLRKKYKSNNQISLNEIKLLNENFKYSSSYITKSFSYQNVPMTIIPYFEQQKTANIVTLFIDITSFSTKCEKFNNSELSDYLDKYYDIVIPIIYKHGGEIEKIIGDGIICVFGEPFLTLSKEKLFEKADLCSKDLIIKLKNTDKEVKIALHDGNVMYYKNKSEDFPEYTMIGKPLTELFRLEGVSESNAINYYRFNDYDFKDFSKNGQYWASDEFKISTWQKSDLIPIKLKGVSHEFIKYFKHI